MVRDALPTRGHKEPDQASSAQLYIRQLDSSNKEHDGKLVKQMHCWQLGQHMQRALSAP
jgi:hypothetical protein